MKLLKLFLIIVLFIMDLIFLRGKAWFGSHLGKKIKRGIWICKIQNQYLEHKIIKISGFFKSKLLKIK